MFIDLTQLERKPELQVDYQYPVGNPDLQDESLTIKSPARVLMRLLRRGREIDARGTVLVKVSVLCDRCLTPVVVEIDSSFNLIYLPLNNLSHTDEMVLERRELDFCFYSNDRLDLDELVREQIQLSLPMTNLCRADCQGLCNQCGQDLNVSRCQCGGEYIDPRWQALLEMKKKSN
ncbi:MAG: DUF177 domain-containing protein [Acidobacteriota bacterium]